MPGRGRKHTPAGGLPGPRPINMAVEITKKKHATDENDLEQREVEDIEDIFDLLDRIPPWVINGFFIFTALYMLYHLTMFCVRAVRVGF